MAREQSEKSAAVNSTGRRESNGQSDGRAGGRSNGGPAKDTRPVDRLISEIKESADRMAADLPSRGDLKIISRAFRELRYAFKVFSPYRARRKVTVFGSARTRPEEPAYQQAVSFGKRMTEAGWFTVTGAASGIMEAGHLGAGRKNSMGLNIMLPFEQDSNPVIAGDHKLVHMKYFFTRKLMFVKECDALCLFPGGFGTLDEGFEVLTLLQTGKRDLVPVVLLDTPGSTYWQTFDRFVRDELLSGGLISPDDLSLYLRTQDIEEAVTEVRNFYRVYHSMRYVRDRLVFRLLSRPTDKLMTEINDEFSDILADGEFTLSRALPEENDQPELGNMPRLVMHFNRRSLGRMRKLINCLNAGSIEPASAQP